jgi:hypothetical protein
VQTDVENLLSDFNTAYIATANQVNIKEGLTTRPIVSSEAYWKILKPRLRSAF